MTKRMRFIVRTLIDGGMVDLAERAWTSKWNLISNAGGREYVNNDTIQRMKSLGYLSYRDEEGNHLGGPLRPTAKAIAEELKP